MRAGVALLLIGAGAALAWLLKGKGKPKRHNRKLTLQANASGCGFEETDLAPATLNRKRGDLVQWLIENPQGSGCPGRPRVCMGRWTLHGRPIEAPVERVGGSDPTDLCAEVPPGVILARAKSHAEPGKYKYSVLVNDVEIIDPMIQIVD